MFGFQFSPEIKSERYWGARAIYQRGHVDILADRQSISETKDSPALTSFVTWLNGYALPWLRKEVERQQLTINDPKVIVLNQFKYELKASTNGSYGYFYIGAIEHTLIDCEPHTNPHTKAIERVVSVNGTKFVVDADIPVGTNGTIGVNGIGPATVVGYYNEPYGEMNLASLMVKAHKPPEWLLTQHCDRDAVKLAKEGLLPKELGSNYPDHKSSKYKNWKKNWELQPFPIFPNDFKPE